MKIFTNIILAALAIVLAINILARIDENKVQHIKNAFITTDVTDKEYKLIPKNYGDDTITVKAQNAAVIHEVDDLFGDTTKYYIFISNNEVINAIRGEKYRLQE